MTSKEIEKIILDLTDSYLQRKECWKCSNYLECPIIDKLYKINLSYQEKYFRLNDMAILCNNYDLDKKKVEGVAKFIRG